MGHHLVQKSSVQLMPHLAWKQRRLLPSHLFQTKPSRYEGGWALAHSPHAAARQHMEQNMIAMMYSGQLADHPVAGHPFVDRPRGGFDPVGRVDSLGRLVDLPDRPVDRLAGRPAGLLADSADPTSCHRASAWSQAFAYCSAYRILLEFWIHCYGRAVGRGADVGACRAPCAGGDFDLVGFLRRLRA